MKRLVLILAVAVALLGHAARAESLCVEAGADYKPPVGPRVSADLGPYCVPVP